MELPKFHNSYFLSHTYMFFILIRAVEKLHKIYSTVFYFTSFYMLILVSTFYLLMSKEKLKRKSTAGCLAFPLSLYVIIFGITGWLIKRNNMSKMNIRCLGHWCYLEHCCLLYVFQVNLVQMAYVASKGCLVPLFAQT